ncbi:MAG: EamA family transporter [Cryptosporangiaceae bacterium]|nr:EamA family transporter [Cryptosporangiaceae bacterium]
MTLALALVAAVGYGISDFLAGLSCRRAPVTQVTAAVQLAALVPAVGIAVASGTAPSWSVVGWGALAGGGVAIGSVALYLGLSRGRMSVVAPVSAVAGAALPVLIGPLTGERLYATAIVGIAVGIPAVLLVATAPSGGGEPRPGGGEPRPGGGPLRDLAFGVVGGLGFSVMYVGYGLADETSAWPVAVSLLVSATAMAVMAVVATGRLTPAALRLPLLAGIVAGTSALFFRSAASGGALAVSSIVTSLYPGVTVLLAALVLREPIGRLRACGLALTLVAVVLIGL